MNILIRKASIDNYDDIIQVWEKSGLHYKPNGRDSFDSIKSELELGIAEFAIAYYNEIAIGSVLITHDGRKGWINRLAVIPEFRRQNIAHKLLEYAEERLYGKGINVIACLIENDNDISMSFFSKEGYTKHDIKYFTKRNNPDA